MHQQTTFREDRTNLEKRLLAVHENRFPIALLLDHITDERNIAAIFRLADAARLEKIYIYQAEGTPNWKEKKINRISRSTTQYVTFEFINTIEDLIDSYHFLALEITQESIAYDKYSLPDKKILLILGNEQSGVSESLLAKCADAVHIPMHGINTSMNVAMATAIVSYDLVKKMQ